MESEYFVQTPNQKKPLGSQFRCLFAAVSMTSMGDGLTSNALPWLATTLTGNVLLVSLLSFSTRLPWLLFSLPFGVLIDRIPRHQLMAVGSLLRAAMITILTVAVFGGWATLPLLIIVTFVFGTAKVMFDSTTQTMVPMVVEKDQLERANGLFSSATIITSDILGGALSGMLLMVGLPLPFMIDAVTSTLAIPLLAGMKGSYRATEKRKHLSFRGDMMEGLKFVWNEPLLRPLALFSIGMTGAFSTITAVQVFFMKEILKLNSFGFGVLISIATVGSIIGGQVVAKVRGKLGARKSILLSIGVMTLCYGLCGLSSHWAVVGTLYTIASFFVVVYSVMNVSFRQRIVPDELLGRVNGVFRFLSWGVSSLGALFGGLLISTGELLVGREWALRLPYLFLFTVYAVLFPIAIRIFNEERLKKA
jgi:MFS family permease